MTVERVKQLREQLAKEREQIKATLDATCGAIQILDKLITEESAEPSKVSS
jgi:hypothetical protein